MKEKIRVLIASCILIYSQSPISAKTIYLIPPLGFEKAPEKFLDPTNPTNLWGDMSIAFGKLISSFDKLGYSFSFTNTTSLPSKLSVDDFLIFAGIKHFHMYRCEQLANKDFWYYETLKLIKKYPKKQLALIVFEPEINDQYSYLPYTHQFFGNIFTCYDNLKGRGYHKFCYPKASLKQTNPLIPFAQRKLCTMILSKKGASFTNKNDIYNQRKKVIKFFETYAPNDFEFYGLRWKSNKHPCYRGLVPTIANSSHQEVVSSQAEIDKINVLRYYRFCFCFENMKDTPGYITEKIFDSFKAGCVPIYWGANNIHKYIPSNCFISRNKYKKLDVLYNFLCSMPESVFNQYLANIKKYLESKEAYLFSVDNFVDSILRPLIPGYNQTKIFTKTECKKIADLAKIKRRLRQ